MLKFFKYIVSVVMVCAWGFSMAQPVKSTPSEAEALVKKAVAFLKANGKEKAYAAFNDQKGAFVERDMYIFVFDLKGLTLAHGGNAKLLGKNLHELKDADDKYFVQAFTDNAVKNGKGWTDYKWVNPVNKQIEQKTSYVEKVGDTVVGCGIYK